MKPNANSFHIVSFGKKKQNLKSAIEKRIIGSNLSTLKNHIKENSQVFLHCDGQIWGHALITSPYIYSETEVWPDKLYPHRFSIEVQFLTNSPITLCDGKLNTELRKRFGAGWAYKFIFSPKPIPLDIAEEISLKLKKQPRTSFNELLI